MNVRTSISRAPTSHHISRHVKWLAVLSFLLAALLMSIVVLTFVQASQLMRNPAKPLDTFTSNILPNYRLASFPSLDEQFTLSGWFFPSEGEPVSTIIMVHDQGRNRLQFELDSASLYQYLIEQHFNVLAFDLRRSGQSEGEMSGFGYAEWADVLAAIKYVRRTTTTHDVILYGFGTGVSASLIAINQLPAAGIVAASAAGDAAAVENLAEYPELIKKAGYDQAYIRGLILDTPCESPDAYIRPYCRQQGFLGRWLLQYTVPYAIRLSAGTITQTNLITVLTRSQFPVFISYSTEDNQVGVANITPLVQERLRLHPDTTIVHQYDQAGYASGFIQDQAAYETALTGFFDRYFP